MRGETRRRCRLGCGRLLSAVVVVPAVARQRAADHVLKGAVRMQLAGAPERIVCDRDVASFVLPLPKEPGR